jgi:hypothetical protein
LRSRRPSQAVLHVARIAAAFYRMVLLNDGRPSTSPMTSFSAMEPLSRSRPASSLPHLSSLPSPPRRKLSASASLPSALMSRAHDSPKRATFSVSVPRAQPGEDSSSRRRALLNSLDDAAEQRREQAGCWRQAVGDKQFEREAAASVRCGSVPTAGLVRASHRRATTTSMSSAVPRHATAHITE